MLGWGVCRSWFARKSVCLLIWFVAISLVVVSTFTETPTRSPQVTAEALRACEALVHTLRPAPPAPLDPAAAGLVGPLLDAVTSRLAGQVRGFVHAPLRLRAGRGLGVYIQSRGPF